MRLLSKTLVELVKLLNDGQYHDGTSLGHHLKITRAAVWKLVKKLEQHAVPLISTKGKGYRLESPLALLDASQIKSQLQHRSVKLVVLEKTASTNDTLKQFSRDNKKTTVLLAETQTAGKGRLHRQWHSPFAENIYLSLMLPFDRDVSELGGLSLVAAMAVCRAIDAVVTLKGKKPTLKWPNDILVEGLKLAGSLIETQSESNGFCWVIIGVGLNVNMRQASQKDVGQAWTSLFKLTGQIIDRNDLCVKIIDTLIDYLERFSSKGLTDFTQEWLKRDSLLNSVVSVVSGNKKSRGICIGINEQGHLMLKAENGEISTFSSGDTTLLK